jgi:tripartite-type tricarboxylate transporter receptor subunit TctC
MKRRNLALAAVALAALVTVTGPVTARAAEAYTNKTMSFIVGFGVGGSYNAYSRLVAAHIGRFLPGKPAMMVQNMPGAGSVRATNYLYEIAAKDGTVIGMIDQAIQAYQLMGRKGLKADTTKFNWIGRLISNSAVLFASSSAPIKKIEDALEKEFIVSASGSASRLNWTIMNNVIGTKIKIITGYKGSGEALLALQRGEIQGLSRPWTALKAKQGDWIKKGKITLLLQTGAEKNDELPNVPRMLDLARNENDRRLLQFFAAPSEIGRSVVAPPGVAADRVAMLRGAFWKAINDPAFQKDLKRSRLELEPLNGEKLQALVEAGKDVSPAIIARAKKLAASVPKKKKKKKKKSGN